MKFDQDFSRNPWKSIQEACNLGIAYKLWPGKKEKLLKDSVTGESFKLTVFIDQDNNLSTKIEPIDPEVNTREDKIDAIRYALVHDLNK